MLSARSHFLIQDQIFFNYPFKCSAQPIQQKSASKLFKNFLNESKYKSTLSEILRHNFVARYGNLFDGFNYNEPDKNNARKTALLKRMAGNNEDDRTALRYFYKEFKRYYTSQELRDAIFEQRVLVESFFDSEVLKKTRFDNDDKRMYLLQSDYYKWMGIPFFRNIFQCLPKYERMLECRNSNDPDYERDLVASKLRYLVEDSKKNGVSSALYMIPNERKQQVAHNSYVISKSIARILNNDSSVLNRKASHGDWSEISGMNDRFFIVYADAELTPSVDAVALKFPHLDVRKVYFAGSTEQGILDNHVISGRFGNTDSKHVVVNTKEALQRLVDA